MEEFLRDVRRLTQSAYTKLYMFLKGANPVALQLTGGLREGSVKEWSLLPLQVCWESLPFWPASIIFVHYDGDTVAIPTTDLLEKHGIRTPDVTSP